MIKKSPTMTVVHGAVLLVFGLCLMRSDAAPPSKKSPPAAAKKEASPPTEAPFQLVKSSEIRLDGRPCRFEEVPDDAEIVLLEIAPRGLVLRVHFESKPPAIDAESSPPSRASPS